MTDTMTQQVEQPDMTGLDPSRPCKEDGCMSFVPLGAYHTQKFCEDHKRGPGGEVGRDRERVGRPPKEKAPRVVLEIGKQKQSNKDKEAARAAQTAAGAQAFANVVATGLSMAGDNVCASAVAQGAAQWSAAVGELSKYQPWLSTIFAPVDGSGQLGAWLGFAVATGAIALPVLAHHNALPDAIATKIAGVVIAADGTGVPA